MKLSKWRQEMQDKRRSWTRVFLAALLSGLFVSPWALAQPLDPGTVGTSPVIGSTGTFSGSVTADSIGIGLGSSSTPGSNCVGASTNDQICFVPNAINYTATGGHNFGHTINSSVAGAGDAIAMSAESEIQWPDTKIAEVGTQLVATAAGGLKSSAGVYANGDAFQCSGGVATCQISTLTPDSVTSPTVPAYEFALGINLTDGDLGWGFRDSASNYVVSITEQGEIASRANAGTAGSGTGLTANFTGRVEHKVHKFTINEAALTAAAGTEDETIWTVPAKTRLLRIAGIVTTAFAGPAITDVKLMCGTSGGSNVYLISQDVDVLNAAIGDVAADIGASLLSATVADIPSVTATQAIVCRFTCTGANCSVMTAGDVTLWIEHLVYP